MRRILISLFLLLPVVDLVVTSELARRLDLSVWLWFAVSGIIGLLTIRRERQSFRSRFMAALTAASGQDPNPWRAVINSGRKVLAGFLLLLPGILTDITALLLLLVPINVAARLIPAWATSRSSETITRQKTYDASYRRVD